MDSSDFTPRLNFDEMQYERLINAGIAAVKGGDWQQARTLLTKASEMKPGDAKPWLWLSATTQDEDEQRHYLEYALAADPSNGAARRGLVMLSEKIDLTRLMQEGEAIQPRQDHVPEAASTDRAFVCRNCGGRLIVDALQELVVCEFCGYSHEIEQGTTGDEAEQVLDFVLPTTRGHRWAESQHRLACSQCGAVSLLAVGEKATQCAHCGSNQMVESAETVELVDPQTILLAKIDQQKATQQFKNWLGKGLFSPDDLKKLVRHQGLRLAYYPFWTFDGTCEMRWSCETNVGSNRNPNWVVRDGVVHKNFNDILIPGLRSLRMEHITQIHPFELDKMVEFKPEYLSGNNALMYDRSLADSSLLAREQVARKLRSELYYRVQVGQEKRNLQAGGVNWSGMTYKHVLLPLWVGSYRYHNQDYRVLINGYNGKVAGEKPRDPVKIVALVALLGASLIVLLLAALLLAFYFGWLSPEQTFSLSFTAEQFTPGVLLKKLPQLITLFAQSQFHV